MQEIILKEVKMYSKLKSSLLRKNFKFTYPELSRTKYPEYFL